MDSTDGTGLVLDNSTGLTWTAKSYSRGPMPYERTEAYCGSLGMRIPTLDEARRISRSDECAFPCNFHTWTSTWAGTDLKWTVDQYGNTRTIHVNSSGTDVLCVR